MPTDTQPEPIELTGSLQLDELFVTATRVWIIPPNLADGERIVSIVASHPDGGDVCIEVDRDALLRALDGDR